MPAGSNVLISLLQHNVDYVVIIIKYTLLIHILYHKKNILSRDISLTVLTKRTVVFCAILLFTFSPKRQHNRHYDVLLIYRGAYE